MRAMNAYKNVLTDMGYRHYKVNHSRWFVGPQSGSHRQDIERAWMTKKGHVHRLTIILRCCWRNISWFLNGYLVLVDELRQPDEPQGCLFKNIQKMFPVWTWMSCHCMLAWTFFWKGGLFGVLNNAFNFTCVTVIIHYHFWR